MENQGAQVINPIIKQPKKSVFGWVILGCVIFGVGLGVVVYQQSIKPAPIAKTTPKPSVAAFPSPIASPVTPDISQVSPNTTGISFSKAGKLRVYYSPNLDLSAIIKDGANSTTVKLPKESSKTMGMVDTGYSLSGAKTLKFDTYAGTDPAHIGVGWTSPVSNKCGFNGATQVDISPLISYATTQSSPETIVAAQCWADYTLDPKDASKYDFNDYILIWTYTPGTTAASATPTPTPTPTPSITPSPSPSRAASPTPTPSARVSMPDTSGGTPVTGVFEVTVGTISVGLILLILGLFGLMAI